MELRKPRRKMPKIPKLNKKVALTITIIIAAIILFTVLSSYLQPKSLNLYFKEGSIAKANDSKTLIVEYRNMEKNDIEGINVSVKAIHSKGIDFPVKQKDYEEDIGKNQVRSFQFPVVLQGLREGSSYVLEVEVKTPESTMKERISLTIEGGD